MSSQVKAKYEEIKRLIMQGQYQQIEAILNRYPNCKQLMQCSDQENKTLLFHIEFVGDTAMALKLTDLFISKGANPREKDKYKQTVIYYIAKLERVELMRKMLQFNYNLNENDFFNQTPLFYAAKHNKGIEISQLLIKYGCDVNHVDEKNQTCLAYAAGAGNLPLCQLLVGRGCNPLHVDSYRTKPIVYARKYNHEKVIEYLNSFKQENKRMAKQVKEMSQSIRMQESSQQQRNRKKDTIRHEYCLTYTNEKGQLHILTAEQLQTFKNINEDYRNIYDAMNDPGTTELTVPATDKKFEKTAMKILNNVWKLDQSFHFYSPVDYKGLGMLDYPNIIKYPMDFGTIRTKLTHNVYDSQLQFQGDMNLVFDNCILYHGSVSTIGKIALQLKLQFNTMFGKQFCI